MNYQKGAVLCNLFLADELNRATSRTQSALLQAMEEGIVTVDNHTYPVPKPFIVIATQNPTGAKGTQMLPDSQMDRFMLRLSMGYPSHDDEIEMIRRKQKGVSTETVQEVVSRDELMRIRKEADSVYVKDEIIDYIVRLCDITRPLRERFLYVCLFTLVKTVKYRSILPFKHFRSLCRMLPEVRKARQDFKSVSSAPGARTGR